jgi:hypothetical protein
VPWFNAYGQLEIGGIGYETLSEFPFRLQPIDMMPARATTEPGADPNNLTNQLATILHESFSINSKVEDVCIKNHTPITTTNSFTLEAI